MMHARPLPLLFLTLLCLLATSACAGSQRESALDANPAELLSAQGTPEAFIARREQGDAKWVNRQERESLEQALVAYAQAAELKPPGETLPERARELAQLRLRLARGYHLLASMHTARQSGPRPKRELRQQYERGITNAEIALSLIDPGFATSIDGDEKALREHLNKAPDEAVPALFWYAANLSEWGHLNGMRNMRYRERVRMIMELVVARDPSFFHAGAHRVMGVYYTRYPSVSGEPEKSKMAFNQSLELAPNCFETRLAYAKHYALLMQDRQLFEKQLRLIAQTDPSVLPELTAENFLVKQEATELLARTDELFY